MNQDDERGLDDLRNEVDELRATVNAYPGRMPERIRLVLLPRLVQRVPVELRPVGPDLRPQRLIPDRQRGLAVVVHTGADRRRNIRGRGQSGFDAVDGGLLTRDLVQKPNNLPPPPLDFAGATWIAVEITAPPPTP
jgi:hypothetical protein